MTFARESIEVLEAMGLGPVWLLRETPDPMVPAAPAASARPQPAAQAAQTASRRSSPWGQQPPAVPERQSPSGVRPQPLQPLGGASPRVSPPAATAKAPAPSASAGMPEALRSQIAAADWETLQKLSSECACCPMSASRQHVVFSDGGPGPKLVVVGEAPGAEEDFQGVPFVGKSGKLLTAMLESVGIVRRRDCVILNVLKCRPPGNRNPDPAEMACCEHWLRRQLELLEPAVLFLAGRFAISALLKPGDDFSIGRMRGRIHEAVLPGGRCVPAVATYHPSYLLRTPDAKSKAWEDLVLLSEALESAGIAPPAREKRWD